ncbi:hypothetical protein GGE68_001400 [Rhizobium leguminosarum]|uniref:hypothetical protein n=1 Tax=Rhizobium leguminosarum TaxID=384 RepID=UPI00161C2C10|nr:hypothetical protein [Rhizobium leguminosarum]MBB5663224.1 hypothetical protein [Rhizobium leguminosarum]
MANAYGYSKISKITPEVFKEPVAVWEKDDGSVEVIEEVCFEIVWVEAEGALYEVTLLKGETLDQVAGRYRVGGYTDDRCTFAKELAA